MVKTSILSILLYEVSPIAASPERIRYGEFVRRNKREWRRQSYLSRALPKRVKPNDVKTGIMTDIAQVRKEERKTR